MHKNNAVNLGGKEIKVLQRSIKIIVVLGLVGLPGFLRGQELFKKKAGVYWLSQRGNETELAKRKLAVAKTGLLSPKISFIVNYSAYSRKAFSGFYRKEPFYFTNSLFFTGHKISHYKLEETDHNGFRLAETFYYRTPGFFCQKELQLDKITTVAFRFRLGSLDYVNWMEQKPNAIKPVVH